MNINLKEMHEDNYQILETIENDNWEKIIILRTSYWIDWEKNEKNYELWKKSFDWNLNWYTNFITNILGIDNQKYAQNNENIYVIPWNWYKNPTISTILHFLETETNLSDKEKKQYYQTILKLAKEEIKKLK